MVTGRIYLVTNTVNGKKYVGKTTVSIEERWKKHLKIGRKRSVLQRAIVKYGKDAFVVEEIATAETSDDLNRLEQEWIRFHGTQIPHGYNVSGGGDGGGIFHARTRMLLSAAVKAFCATEEGRRARAFSEQRKAEQSKRVLALLVDPRKREQWVARAALMRTPEVREKVRITKANKPRVPKQLTQQHREAVAAGMSQSEKWKSAKERLLALRRTPEYRARISASARARWARTKNESIRAHSEPAVLPAAGV